jgi:hypothetical protein
MSGRRVSSPLRAPDRHDYQRLLDELKIPMALSQRPKQTWTQWATRTRMNDDDLYEEDVPQLIKELQSAIATGATISEKSISKLKHLTKNLTERQMKRDNYAMDERAKSRAMQSQLDSLTPAQLAAMVVERDRDAARIERELAARQQRDFAEQRESAAAASGNALGHTDRSVSCPRHFCNYQNCPSGCPYKYNHVGGKTKRGSKTGSKTRSKTGSKTGSKSKKMHRRSKKGTRRH